MIMFSNSQHQINLGSKHHCNGKQALKQSEGDYAGQTGHR